MNSSLKQNLEQNIVKYSWYKVFTKRLFFPLITIQLVTEGKVTVEQLAIIVVVSSIIQALLQMPAGYIADKWGNRKSIILGAAISAPSPLLYVFMPDFIGGLIASVLFFGGYAFQSGAIEAFVHNTLIALGKEKDYAKVMGRAQTYGLIGNVVLITLVPATYAIHHSIPFLLGFVSLLVMLGLTISFVHPRLNEDFKIPPKHPLRAIKSIVTAENIMLFIFAGFLAGVSNRGGEFQQLLLQSIGVAVALLGVLAGIGSLVGAGMGWYIHIFDRLKPLVFYFVDLLIISTCLAVVGLTDNPVVAVIGFTVFAGYTRVRMIIFQAKLLHEIKHVYKATLISALNLFTLIGDIAAITILTKFIDMSGYLQGYLFFGLSVFAIGTFLWLAMALRIRRRQVET